MLISLSIVAKENNYTRPTFSRYNELIIKDEAMDRVLAAKFAVRAIDLILQKQTNRKKRAYLL